MSSPTNASLLEVEVSEDDRLLTLRGELCLSTADQLREPVFAAVDGARGDIVLDPTECTFIDSSGLEVFSPSARGGWLPRIRGASSWS